MPDNRFKDFPTDHRFPGGGVDVRFQNPPTDGRFNSPGNDTQFMGSVYGGGAATVPAAMTVGQWTLADSPSAGGNTLTVNIVSAPANGGSVITSYEFRRNGGSWTALTGGTSLGARSITVVATTLANIEVRAVNAIGPANTSDTKSATPTVAATAPAAMTIGQWTLADSPSAGGDTLTVNLVSAPANGGSAITSYEFRRNGGSWSTLPGGTGLGARNITVLATTLANIELRAVNAVGGATASDTKSATPTVSATAPAAMTVGQWTLADSPSAGGNTLTVNLVSAPANGGSAITSYEYRRNGGSWTTLTGGTALGARAITVVATTLANIEVRAVNAIGGATASDTKSATPTVSGNFVARFGIGAENGSGTGAFDTNLYTGSPPANGTYGNFTVSAGIITPNGSQTVGSYSPGGYPVEVVANLKAVANQTQMNAISGADSGKTILVREGAAITLGTGWNSGVDFGWATILGDGPDLRADYLDAAKDSRKHFVSINLRNHKRLIWDQLNIVTGSTAGVKVDAFECSQTGGGNSVSDVQVVRCRVICSRPDPLGNYAAGFSSVPGASGITFAGVVNRISVRDNVILGPANGVGAIAMTGVTGFSEIVGNHIDLPYSDAIRPGNTRVLVSSNLVTRPLALASDAGNPHGDAIQFLGGEGVVEGLAMVQGVTGATRGDWQNFWAANASDYRLVIRDCVISDFSLYAYSIQDAQGSTVENCVWIPSPGTSLPVSGTRGGLRYGHTSGVNEFKNSVHRAGSAVVAGGVTQTGVVDSTSWNTTDYNTNFPNWSFSGVPTLQNVLSSIGQGAAAAAGKGPRITSTGAERSATVYNLTAPTLSSLSLTPVSDGFSGTVASNQTRAPIFWVVVANGSPAPNWRQIKERRATGAVVYGDGWVTGATLALSATGLNPSTTYTVYAVQETGYSTQSNILSGNVTTSASSGVTVIGVGTVASSNSTSSLGINIPTAVNGDYLVAFVAHGHTNNEPTTPAGWSIIGNGAGWNPGDPATIVYARVRDGSEGSTLTVTTGAAARMIGFIAACRTVSGPGANGTANSFNPSSQATPSITASNLSAVLHSWSHNANGGTVTLPNPGSLIASGYTPDGVWFLGAEILLSTSAGATAQRTATSTNTSNWNALQVELLKA